MMYSELICIQQQRYPRSSMMLIAWWRRSACPTTSRRFVDFLARWQDELAGVVASRYNWYWLVDGLQDAGFHLHLANTAAIKQYEGLKHTHSGRAAPRPPAAPGHPADRHDLPREQRAVRDLARKRMQLVHSCTTHVLAVENIMARQLAGG